VLKVNVEVGNVHALLRTENATRMFVGIVGSGEFIIVFIFCFTTFYHSLGKKTKALAHNSFRASVLSRCLLVKDLSHLSIQYMLLRLTRQIYMLSYDTTTVKIRSPLLTSENNSIGKLFVTSWWLPCKYKYNLLHPQKEKRKKKEVKEIEEKKGKKKREYSLP
jgi:hypothetical protein